MKFVKALSLLGLVALVGTSVVSAGINSKEIGAVLFYPEYQAQNGSEVVDTYISITNDKSMPVVAHVEVIGDEVCDDCNFDLVLTGFQTKRLRFTRENVGPNNPSTVIYDASAHSTTGTPAILAACPEPQGFVVVTLEYTNESYTAPAEPRRTSGENMLHGDAVIVNLDKGTSSQMGAIAVQGASANDGDRVLRFDNSEYYAFPNIVTANFWAERGEVEPELILFNVNRKTGEVPVTPTFCALNYVNAEEDTWSRDYNFDCWTRISLLDLGPNFHENILGTANGFLWAQCSPGTHGAIVTELDGNTPNYPYPGTSEHRDTLFQDTLSRPATLELTPSITGGGPPG